MLNKFYDDPTAPPDLGCVDEMEAPDFVAPLFRTAIGPRLALRAFEDRKALIAPAAWLTTSLLAVLIAFFVLSAGPVARRLDGRTGAGSAGARWMTWSAAMLGTLSAVIIGAGAAVTYDITGMLLLFGLVPWAKFGAYTGLLAGIAGIAGIALTIRSQLDERLPVATLTGFILSGMAAISLSAFLLAWDLGPF